MRGARAFVGIGSNVGDPPAGIEAALAALDRDGVRVAAAARILRGPYEPVGTDAPDVFNTVAEIRTRHAPRALLARLLAIEAAAGRCRADARERALDLDLLAYEDAVCAEADLVLPHPRLGRRAFVLAPWEEVAPRFVVPASPATGPAASVVEHAAALRRDRPAAFDRLTPVGIAPFAAREGALARLESRSALAAWRAAASGPVGVVPTMGALHDGHGALVQRAAAECDAVVATLFVNPLQFAPGEDLARYPRTFEADCDVLQRHGARAVYAPSVEDLYPPGFATGVVVDEGGAAYEGAARPSHFRGVATVVLKLWMRTWPDRIYFGRKDAQQLALIRRMARDLDLPGTVVDCPTVREADGLALSSRNRYLSAADRQRSLALARGLAAVALEAARGTVLRARLTAAGRPILEEAGLEVDYFDVVDPHTFEPCETLQAPALAIAAARAGAVRLLDNRWIAPPAAGAAVPAAGETGSRTVPR